MEFDRQIEFKARTKLKQYERNDNRKAEAYLAMLRYTYKAKAYLQFTNTNSEFLAGSDSCLNSPPSHTYQIFVKMTTQMPKFGRIWNPL